MIPYLELNVVNFLKVDIDHLKRITETSGTAMTRVPIYELVSEDFINSIYNKTGILLNHCIVFNGRPNTITEIHKDNGNVNINGQLLNTWAINIVLNSTDHFMQWYSEKTTTTAEIKFNKAASKYYSYSLEDVTEKAKLTISKPTLVRTDVPHNIINNNSLPRYCVSVRSNHSNLTWEQAFSLFEKVN